MGTRVEVSLKSWWILSSFSFPISNSISFSIFISISVPVFFSSCTSFRGELGDGEKETGDWDGDRDGDAEARE